MEDVYIYIGAPTYIYIGAPKIGSKSSSITSFEEVVMKDVDIHRRAYNRIKIVFHHSFRAIVGAPMYRKLL